MFVNHLTTDLSNDILNDVLISEDTLSLPISLTKVSFLLKKLSCGLRT